MPNKTFSSTSTVATWQLSRRRSVSCDGIPIKAQLCTRKSSNKDKFRSYLMSNRYKEGWQRSWVESSIVATPTRIKIVMFRIIVIQIIMIRIIMVSAIIREDSRRWAHSPIVATPGKITMIQMVQMTIDNWWSLWCKLPGEVELREVAGPLEEPVECAGGAAVPHLACNDYDHGFCEKTVYFTLPF